MDPLVIVSPHLDDAVLGNGQLMAGRPDCVVLTCFTSCPTPQVLTSFDKNCGFKSSGQAVKGRAAEDDQALAKLSARPVRLDFADGQYGVAVDVDTLAGAIADAVEASGADAMVVPLGIAHPDHRLVAEACERVFKAASWLHGWIYEELPSRVLWPDQVPERLDWWRAQGWQLELDFIGTGAVDHKAAALRCYASQLWALDWHSCLVPERHWRVQ